MACSLNDIKSERLAIACEYVFEGDERYFLTAPKSAESLLSFQAFKKYLKAQLTIIRVIKKTPPHF